MIDAAQPPGRLLTVGHIERFNPAIRELRRRLAGDELGRIFQVSATPARPVPGPHPRRRRGRRPRPARPRRHALPRGIRAGPRLRRDGADASTPITRTCSPGSMKFANGVVGLLDINWLTPTKQRTLTVTGERGMYVADYIAQDLVLLRQPRRRGHVGEPRHGARPMTSVAEGEMTRRAIRREEPLTGRAARVRRARCARADRPGRPARRDGRPSPGTQDGRVRRDRPGDRRRGPGRGPLVKIAVVGLGHIGLPLAVQYASRGHDVLGVDVAPWIVDAINRGESPHRDEQTLIDRVPELVAAGRCARRPGRSRGRRGGRGDRRHRAGRGRRASARSTSEPIDAATRDIAAHRRRRRAGRLRDDAAGRHHPRPLRTDAGRGKRPELDRDLFLAFSPERVLVGRVFLDLQRYPKIVGRHERESRRGARSTCTRRSSIRDRTVMRTANAETAEMTKLAETTYRDVNIAYANELARYAAARGIDVIGGHRRGELAAVQPHPPAGCRRRRALHPGLPALPVQRRPGPADPAAGARDQRGRWARSRSTPSRIGIGSLDGQPVLVLGVAYRGDVKEDAFSSRLPAARRAARGRRAGARPRPVLRRRAPPPARLRAVPARIRTNR